MKRIVQIFVPTIFFFACEDVIEVDTPTEEPRLIVEAVFRVDVSKPSAVYQIKVGETSSFFEGIRPTSLEYIDISGLFPKEAAPGSGIYEIEISTEALLNEEMERWELSMIHNDQIYLAFAEYIPTVPIDTVFQGDETLFTGDETEILVSFTDSPDQDNFYLFDFNFDEYLVTEDEFYQGQPFQFSYFYQDGLKSGQNVDINILGVDERFYNYMNQLIVQAGGNQGPFQTPAATVRGNIINVTEIDNIDFFDNVEQTDNFALGYFAICQTFTESIVIE